MLVISRRKGQRVTIGDDIEIVVTSVHKSGIKLGIIAPRGHTILRGEVRDAILAANREAALSSVELGAVALHAGPRSPDAGQAAAKLGLGRQRADGPTSQGGDASGSERAAATSGAADLGPRGSRRATEATGEPGLPQDPP
jgi:carbon storage regulator